MNYTRILKKHMVEVYFLNDGIKTFDPDGELRLSIMATLAQDESRKTSVRVKAGQQTSMEKGVIFGNGNVLGYDRVGREYVVNPSQSEIVRDIFKWYSEGKGLQAIKWELEKSGAKTAMGKTTWDLSTISRILQNRLYVGMLTYHRQYTPDYLEQKKVTNHGEIELLQLEGRHEHIISDELFNQVQKKLESRRRENRNMVILSRAQNGGAKTPDVWTRKLLCACGTSSTGCAGIRQNRGLSTEGICTSPAVPDWRLQMMACAIFRLFTPAMEDVFELTKTTLGRHIGDDDSRNKEAEQIERIKAEIGDLESCLNGLVEQRINGDLSKEDFSAKKTEYEAKITNLSSTLKELTKV